MTNWKEYRIGDITTWRSGGTPSKQIEEFWNGNIPWVSAKTFNSSRISDSETRITAEGLANGSRLAEIDSILLLVRGSGLFNDIPIGIVELPVAFNQDIKSIEVNKKIASPLFLLYWFKANKPLLNSKLEHTGIGAGKFETDIIKNLPIQVPNHPTQTAIAEILSSLDDKIELNNQINQELEALAQALFKQWFIDFEFPNEKGEPYKSSGGEMVDSELGEIPKEWSVSPIRELFDLVVGGDWGKDVIDDEHTEMMYVIRGTDLPTLRNGRRDQIPFRAIKPSKLKQRKLQEGDIVIEISGGSKDQPTGRSILITKEILDRLNDSVIPASFCRLIRPKSEFPMFLNVYLTKLYNDGKTWEYQNQSTGISNFQFKYFESKEMLALPNRIDLVRRFSELTSDIYSLITSNESLELIHLRDYLLPNLISGELEIKAARTKRKS